MKMALSKCLLLLAMLASIAGAAHAHPHMFFDSSAQFVLDEKGRLSKLRVVFLVDELNTIYTLAELGVNKDGDQTLTPEEADKVARTVLEGFGHYRFFTYLKDQVSEIRLGKPIGVTAELQKSRLGLAFVIPLEKPYALAGKSIALQLYDPTYFTAITVDLTPTVVNAANSPIAGCAVSVLQPDQTTKTRRKQTLLSQLSREQTPETENVGAIFAQTTRLTCRS